MNKQYLNKLNERLINGEKLTKTERQIALAYRDMLEYEYNWMGFSKTADIDPEELSLHMLVAEINEIYITEGWSGQFESWYEMQEAGFKIDGIKKIDNPKYLIDIKMFGRSHNDKILFVLVFKSNNPTK